MKINRPLWSAGALLSQQQFQQQSRWETWSNDCLAQMTFVHAWGVRATGFDIRALELGKLKAERLCVRLPDGTLVDTDHVDRLPPAIDLNASTVNSDRKVTVYLALPLEQANGNNCLFDGDTPDRPTRYRQDWRQVQDVYADDDQSMAVLEHMLTLRLDTDDNADYVTCPVARVMRDGQGAWALDSGHVPPLLSFAAHPELLSQLDNLLTQLSAKRQRLMGMRHESAQRMADFAVADVSLFWLLNALNTYQPMLANLKTYPARHPESVYLELAKFAGALLTFSLEFDVSDVPIYRHDCLENVFSPLMKLISRLLDASLPTRVIALALEAKGANRWQVTFEDMRLRESGAVDFYLSVRCRESLSQVQAQFPRLCKVGTPDDVDRLINSALDGVPLKALTHVPAAVPVRFENQYFALDFAHPMGKAVLAEGICAVYVPGTLNDLELELFAVLRK